MLIAKKRMRNAPAISTASLPDIIFMLLFFFMVTVSFRDETLKINPRLASLPATEDKERFPQKMNVYVVPDATHGALVQAGDTLMPADSLAGRLAAWRRAASAAPHTYALVLHVDKDLPLAALRKIRKSLKGDAPVRVFYRADNMEAGR